MKLRNLPRRLYWSAYLMAHVVGQARYPFSSPRRIARDADRRARRMVAYAYRWVPYYRETLDRMGLTPDEFRCVADLRRLPLISVRDLQQDSDRFRSLEFPKDELLPETSSGSTGAPHTIWHGLSVLYQTMAHGERETSIHRHIIGKGRHLRAMGIRQPLNVTSRRDVTRANSLHPTWADMWRGGSQRQATVFDPPETIIGALNERRPDIFYAYGSMLALLYTYAHKHGLDIFCPTIVRYASDGLPIEARQLLTETYGLQVFSAYQSIEMFKTGFECKAHRGYHINADLYPVRIVDEEGNDCPPGVEGEIVCSNLVNRATVLLNYRMGDRAAWLDGPCPCGRNLPMISFIQGRTVDSLLDTAGRRFFRSVAVGPVRSIPGVYQYQIVQTALDHLQVKLVVADECDREAAVRSLTTLYRERFGADMQVEVRFVQEIERTPAGKLRYIRNLVDEGAS